MTMRRAAAFLLLAAWAGLARAEQASFAMKVSATVSGPWIRLGEVLEGALPEKLAKVRLRRHDGPGKITEISRDFAALKAREARIPGIRIEGASCSVLGSSRVIPGADLQAFAEKYVRGHLDKLSGTAKIEVEFRETPPDLVTPDRETRLEIPGRADALRGNVILRVIAKQETGEGGETEVGQALVRCLIKAKQPRLVASKRISRGDLIDAGNTRVEEQDLTYEREAGYPDLAGAQGLKARTMIGEGKAVLPVMLERPPLVKRGDIVKLVVRSGLVAVESSAKAMRDGALGDSIPVEVIESKKQLQGRVADVGTVVSETR